MTTKSFHHNLPLFRNLRKFKLHNNLVQRRYGSLFTYWKMRKGLSHKRNWVSQFLFCAVGSLD
jgi:hypothetical protein